MFTSAYAALIANAEQLEQEAARLRKQALRLTKKCKGKHKWVLSFSHLQTQRGCTKCGLIEITFMSENAEVEELDEGKELNKQYRDSLKRVWHKP